MLGIAKLAAEEGGDELSLQTKTGQMLGTPVYMSPEQCRGNKVVSAPTDVYSLGVMMYEMLTGKPPFRSSGVGELMMMHMMAEPTPLAESAPGITAPLAILIHAMLAKEPKQRPTMVDVTRQLKEIPETGVRIRPRPGLDEAEDSLSSLGLAASEAKTESVDPLAGTPPAGALGRPPLPITAAPTDRSTVISVSVGPAAAQPPQPDTSRPTSRRSLWLALGLGAAALCAIAIQQGIRVSRSHSQKSASEKPAIQNDTQARTVPANTTGPASRAIVAASAAPQFQRPTPTALSEIPAGPEERERTAQRALEEGNPQQAVVLLQALAVVRPKRPTTYAILCRAYESLGQTRNAEAVCRSSAARTARAPVMIAKPVTPDAKSAVKSQPKESSTPPTHPNHPANETQVEYLR